MPTVNPFAPFLLGPIAVVCIWILVALPAYPHSVKAKIAWIALFAFVSALFYNTVLAPNPVRIRTAPVRSVLVLIFLLYLPFLVSFALWRSRRIEGSRVGRQTVTLLIIAVWVFSVTAVKGFNRTCVYHYYWHDKGEAWCTKSWQAGRHR